MVLKFAVDCIQSIIYRSTTIKDFKGKLKPAGEGGLVESAFLGDLGGEDELLDWCDEVGVSGAFKVISDRMDNSG